LYVARFFAGCIAVPVFFTFLNTRYLVGGHIQAVAPGITRPLNASDVTWYFKSLCKEA